MIRKRKQQFKVAYEEAAALWYDYALALHDTESVTFTERCTNISRRIISMGKAFGPVHWRDIPLSVVVTHYETTYGRGNIDFPRVNWSEVNELSRQASDIRTSLFTPSPVTITDLKLITAAGDSNVNYDETVNVIPLEGQNNDNYDVHNDLGSSGRHHIA